MFDELLELPHWEQPITGQGSQGPSEPERSDVGGANQDPCQFSTFLSGSLKGTYHFTRHCNSNESQLTSRLIPSSPVA